MALVLALVAESYLGSTRYRLNGVTYAVPHSYEFMRNFRVPWLDRVSGLDDEPGESVWLLLPADELARDIEGYSRTFRGYSSDVEADMVVNILGGREASEFPEDFARSWREVAQLEEGGASRRPDVVTGWDRISRAEGDAQFYLVPKPGNPVPRDRLPPSCLGLASVDSNRRVRFRCSFVIHRNGLTFDFDLRQENLGTANRIPGYILARLSAWRL